jgi:hypothetical protein
MPYYPDLSAYTFVPPAGDPPAVNVGWLHKDQPFERGDVPYDFVNRLKRLALARHNQTRGFHVCEFCQGLRALLASGKEASDLRKQCAEDYRISSAEVRVQDRAGRWYAAPQMIAHYVEAHGYRPPQEFIDAVMRDD